MASLWTNVEMQSSKIPIALDRQKSDNKRLHRLSLVQNAGAPVSGLVQNQGAFVIPVSIKSRCLCDARHAEIWCVDVNQNGSVQYTILCRVKQAL